LCIPLEIEGVNYAGGARNKLSCEISANGNEQEM
jgi:hypothetical protein